MIHDVCGAVLAGGRGRRFGRDKAQAPWGGATLVEAVCDTLSGLFAEQLVVVKTPGALARLARPDRRVVCDGLSEHHALGGLRAALLAASAGRVFACACDMPFLQPALIRALCAAGAGFDAAVPEWEGALQPLCAVYSRSCLPEIERLLGEGRLSVKGLFARVRTRVLSEAEVREADPEGRSFVDLDTPGDYAAWAAAAPQKEGRPQR